MDGILDEPAWGTAPVAANLRTVEPREGEAATGATEIRVLAGPRALVFGIVCRDPEPAGIVSFTKQRDGDLGEEDHVAVVLDPFQDGRSGYLLAVNPGGARLDGLIENRGEGLNVNWDGIWEAATHRDETGWAIEIRLPVDTLSFPSGATAWGFNVQRRIQRLQETSRWAGARVDWEITQTSRAGHLEGLPDFDLGLGLTLRPAAVGGYSRPAPEVATDWTADPSLDLNQRLGPGLAATATVHTDFAETEVDTRRINLTRFPLFYPEKRYFFLEGADLFDFGLGLGQDVIPFFSRRIGLVEGREVPLRVGAKLTGRAGPNSLGGLAVRTGEVADVAPATTMGVVRLRRNVWAESSVGVMGTVGDPLGRPDSWVAGADFTYQTSRLGGDKNFLVGIWALVNDRADLAGDKTAVGFKVDYPNDRWDVFATYKRIGDGFDPSLGFVPRRGVQIFQWGGQFAPRPGSWIRQMFFEMRPRVVTDLGGRWETYDVPTSPLNLQLESGERVALGITPGGDRFAEPFEIAPEVVVPAGEYHWTRVSIEVETARKRRLAGQVQLSTGGYYGGTLDTIGLEAAWTPSPILTLFASGEYNRGRLPGGDFDQTLLAARLRLNLSPDLDVNSLLQYDTESRLLGTNTRLRWIFHPRGELFLIYNHNSLRTDERWQRESDELMLKVKYALRL